MPLEDFHRHTEQIVQLALDAADAEERNISASAIQWPRSRVNATSGYFGLNCIQRKHRPIKIPEWKQAIVGARHPSAVALHQPGTDRLEYRPAIHTRLQQQKARSPRIDSDAFEHAEVPRFVSALREHKPRAPGIKDSGSPHERALPRVGRSSDHVLPVGDRTHDASDGNR